MAVWKKAIFSSEDFYIYALGVYLVRSLILQGVNWTAGILEIVGRMNIVANLLIACLLLAKGAIDLIKGRGKYFIIMTVVLTGLYLSYRNTQNDVLLYSAVFIVMAGNLSFDRIVKLHFKIVAGSVLCAVVFCAFGMAQDIVIDFRYGTGHSFGTYHPNMFAAMVSSASLAWGYLQYKIHPYKISGGLLTVSVFLYLLTMSRTNSVIVAFFAFMILIYKMMERTHTEKLLNLLKITVLAAMGGAIYLMLFYQQIQEGLLSDANFLVRFSQGYGIYQRYGISLFGNQIKLVTVAEAIASGKSAAILDSAYLSLLLNHGLAATVLFLFCQMKIFKRAIQKRNYMIILIATLYAVSGFMEQNIFIVYYNFTLLTTFGKLVPQYEKIAMKGESI